jgi:hypothetical protein
LGQALTSETGKEIQVALKCICRATLTSAAYAFLDGLLWSSTTTLAADSAANTIGWYYDWLQTGQTVTSGRVLFDVIALGKLAGVDA